MVLIGFRLYMMVDILLKGLCVFCHHNVQSDSGTQPVIFTVLTSDVCKIKEKCHKMFCRYN